MRPEPEATGRRGTTESRCRVSGQSETGSGEGLGRAAVAHERRRVAGAARFPRLDRRLAVRRGLPVRPMARVRRLKPALAPEFAGLLAAAITRMVAVVGDADPVEPSQRVRIGVTDSVGAHPDQEVVSIREDVAGPADHAVVRRVVPGAAVPLTSRRRMDRDRSVAHLELIG
jgi:hypothetical protein